MYADGQLVRFTLTIAKFLRACDLSEQPCWRLSAVHSVQNSQTSTHGNHFEITVGSRISDLRLPDISIRRAIYNFFLRAQANSRIHSHFCFAITSHTAPGYRIILNKPNLHTVVSISFAIYLVPAPFWIMWFFGNPTTCRSRVGRIYSNAIFTQGSIMCKLRYMHVLSCQTELQQKIKVTSKTHNTCTLDVPSSRPGRATPYFWLRIIAVLIQSPHSNDPATFTYATNMLFTNFPSLATDHHLPTSSDE
jgi:hypothetical protein